MHYFTFAEKDTTLYQGTGSLNAGLDEVLEVWLWTSSTFYALITISQVSSVAAAVS